MQAITVYINNDICRLLKNSLYYTVFTCIVLSQAVLQTMPIAAYEIKSMSESIKAKNNISAVDIEAETIRWNESLNERYKNAKIVKVADGIVHVRITKYINSKKIQLNVVEMNKKLNPEAELTPALAADKLNRRSTTSKIAQRNNAIVAINGTYFSPQTGIPLGTLMINHKLYTGPIYERVALGIFENDFDMSRTQLDATIRSRDGAGGYKVKLDNVNQPRMLSTYVLVYTKEWGAISPPTPKYGIQIAVENTRIKQISNGAIEIPEQGYVISGPKEKLQPFFNAKNLELDIKTNPAWDDVKHIISGGPFLVKNGEIYVDTQAQKLNSITGKNPRTAVGYTEDKNLILVTVDGREENSVGMTLNELANYMKSIGCTNAMNLDGGGSSTMYVNGSVVNNTAVKGGIAVSNILSITLNSKISYSK